MQSDLKSAADQFLAGEDGQRLSRKKEDLKRLAASADGEKVRSMLEKGGFEDAVRRGDTGALKNAVSDIMKTDSGARLMRELQALMGKK